MQTYIHIHTYIYVYISKTRACLYEPGKSAPEPASSASAKTLN